MKNAVDYMCELLYNNEEDSLTNNEEKRLNAENDSVLEGSDDIKEIELLKNRIAELETKLSNVNNEKNEEVEGEDK